MDAQLEEYLRRRRQPMALEEEDVESSDPGDMDRSLSPQPLLLRERPRFDNLMAGLDAPRLQAEADVALERGAADDVADMAGRRLGKDSVFAPREAGTFSPLAAGRGVPAPNDEGSGGGYLAALRRAQRMDDLSAGMRRVYDSGQQLAEITSRGAYKAQPLGDMPSEVSKEEKRRAVVAEYLKQKRDGALADADIRLKNAHADFYGNPKPTPPAKPVLSQEQFDRLTESQIDANNRRGQPKPSKPPRPTTGLTREERITTDLRREFETQPAVKTFGEVQSAFGKVSEAAKGNSPASDLSMLYSYAKLLDPGSVVRESEFQTMAQTGAFGDKVAAAVKKLAIGERLTEAQRADFVKAAKQQFDVYGKQFDESAARYEALAKKSGVTPEDVVFRRKAFVQGQQAAGMAPDKKSRLEELRAKRAAGTLEGL
jgi:hypothetical protein